MSFPTDNAGANVKRYAFPITPFSKRNDNRIANFFRLRNVEDDLNDWSSALNAYLRDEFTTEVLTMSVSFTASEKVKNFTFTNSQITKSGKSPVAIFAIDTNNDNIDVIGFNLNGDSATVRLRDFVNSTGTGAAHSATLTLEVLYRKNFSAYVEKQ